MPVEERQILERKGNVGGYRASDLDHRIDGDGGRWVVAVGSKAWKSINGVLAGG